MTPPLKGLIMVGGPKKRISPMLLLCLSESCHQYWPEASVAVHVMRPLCADEYCFFLSMQIGVTSVCHWPLQSLPHISLRLMQFVRLSYSLLQMIICSFFWNNFRCCTLSHKENSSHHRTFILDIHWGKSLALLGFLSDWFLDWKIHGFLPARTHEHQWLDMKSYPHAAHFVIVSIVLLQCF